MRRPVLLLAALLACSGSATDSGPVGPADGTDGTDDAPWSILIDEDARGAWLSAWGTGTDDVWVVGGQPTQGAVLRGPIDDLQPLAVPEGTPLLNWVHGTGPDDVWVAGIAGTLLRWDGAAWTDHSIEMEEALWGVYAVSDSEVYAVGGQSGFGGADAVALAWADGGWTRLALPEEVAGLSNLFKVHHDGTHLWMVGFQGVALRLEEGALVAVPTGTTADLVTANADGGPMLIVGGRGTGVVVEADGTTLTATTQAQAGLNGVQVYPSGVAVVAGEAGYTARYDPATDTLTADLPVTRAVLHATWGVPGERMLAVGGNLFTAEDTFVGTILVGQAPE